MAVYIAHACCTERPKPNDLGDGVPGDQTGLEVCTQLWYTKEDNPWDWVARPKNTTVASNIAAAMEQAANNNNIGYNQYITRNGVKDWSVRMDLWNLLAANGWNMQAINTPTNTDCSGLVACACRCAGITNVSGGMTTADELQKLSDSGFFDILTDSALLGQGVGAKRGDIYHRSGHTMVVIQNTENVKPEPVGARMWMGWSKFESGKEYTDNSGWYIMGGTGGGAYGRYQFHYTSALVDFMQLCVNTNTEHYSGFTPYIALGKGNPALAGNHDLQALFQTYTASYLNEFATLQNHFMWNQFYLPIHDEILNRLGFDIGSLGPYAAGSVASIAIRNGNNWTSVKGVFEGITMPMSERDFIKLIYAREVNYYPDSGRWVDNDSYSQYRRVFADMDAGAGVYQIGEGTIIPEPDAPSPVNPGSDIGDDDNPVPNPTPITPPQQGNIVTGTTFNPYWILKMLWDNLPLT